MFFALCSPSAQSLNIVRFAWSWARLDTFTLREDAPQNRSQNGYAVVKVSPLVFRVFFALCSPSAQSLNMVRFSWSWTRSDTSTLREDAPQNRLQNGYAIVKVSPLVFHVFLFDAYHLLSHLIWSVFYDLGLVWIPSRSVKTLHKTVHETVKLLWR